MVNEGGGQSDGQLEMKRRDRRVTGTNARNLIKVIWRNLYKPTGHAAATMINDSRDRWRIRLLIFQYKKRSRSLSWKGKWDNPTTMVNSSAAQVDRNASWSEKKGGDSYVLEWSLNWQKKTKHFTFGKIHLKPLFHLQRWIFIKAPETVHYLPWHKCSSLDSKVNYLSHLLHAKWCNSHERLGGIVTFLCLFLQHLLTEFTCAPVGLLFFVFFIQSKIPSLYSTHKIWCYIEVNVEYWGPLLPVSPWSPFFFQVYN